jgi:hypothetical protein
MREVVGNGRADVVVLDDEQPDLRDLVVPDRLRQDVKDRLKDVGRPIGRASSPAPPGRRSPAGPPDHRVSRSGRRRGPRRADVDRAQPERSGGSRGRRRCRATRGRRAPPAPAGRGPRCSWTECRSDQRARDDELVTISRRSADLAALALVAGMSRNRNDPIVGSSRGTGSVRPMIPTDRIAGCGRHGVLSAMAVVPRPRVPPPSRNCVPTRARGRRGVRPRGRPAVPAALLGATRPVVTTVRGRRR